MIVDVIHIYAFNSTVLIIGTFGTIPRIQMNSKKYNIIDE